ncbi:sugar phosphate exchanger 3 isoform X3 [Alligator sinensis]|uniref:Sugar phosphate exchanger 3 n=1 Tax=Alligator sinensis TaxID=38654 RepID=A0A3Q0G4W9_ALLSI|nr:sugar phosphate exchanger 3 isoform X3 [Alligator sinensis]
MSKARENRDDLSYRPVPDAKGRSRKGEARRMAMPRSLRRQPGNRALASICTHHHIAVFLLTFFSYSLLHASRKTFSNVKVSISSQWTPTFLNSTAMELQPYELWNSSHLFSSAEEATLFLGTLDTIFLFSYAVGLFVSGIVGDRLNLRWVLSFGMCSSALVVFLFGTVTEWLHFYNKWFYCCLWVLNGLLQSTGWPCVVAVMGNWFGKAGRGFVFGLWSACASVGNILGAFLASCVLKYGYEYSLAYACLKLVNYSFFFWLPFYLSNNFGWREAEADQLSIWYDVGGIIGGTIQGLISDMLRKRAPVLAISLLLAVGALFGYSRSPDSKPINAVIMAVTGFFIGGPSNMISSAISADLGRQELVRGSSEALATVTGIVDGTGSIGAAVGQYLVSLIQENLGWMWVFYFFILMISSTVLFISPLVVREIRLLLQERRLRRLTG